MHSLGVNTVQMCPFRKGTVPLTDLYLFFWECVTLALFAEFQQATVQGRESVQVAGGAGFDWPDHFARLMDMERAVARVRGLVGYDWAGHLTALEWRRSSADDCVCVCAVGRWSRSVTDELWMDSVMPLWNWISIGGKVQLTPSLQEEHLQQGLFDFKSDAFMDNQKRE